MTLDNIRKDAAAKSLQSCPTLHDPIDGSPPGPAVPGILQARTLEWVAIAFSSAWKWKVKVKSLSLVWLLATPWTAAHQAPQSMGFSLVPYKRNDRKPSLTSLFKPTCTLPNSLLAHHSLFFPPRTQHYLKINYCCDFLACRLSLECTHPLEWECQDFA